MPHLQLAGRGKASQSWTLPYDGLWERRLFSYWVCCGCVLCVVGMYCVLWVCTVYCVLWVCTVCCGCVLCVVGMYCVLWVCTVYCVLWVCTVCCGCVLCAVGVYCVLWVCTVCCGCELYGLCVCHGLPVHNPRSHPRYLAPEVIAAGLKTTTPSGPKVRE